MDLSHSFLAAAGAEGNAKLDGIDILSHVREGRPDEERELYWRAKRGDRTWWAVRDGDWKWVRKQEGGEEETWLFDLAQDPGETTNLLDVQETTPAKLEAKLKAWEEEVKPVR